MLNLYENMSDDELYRLLSEKKKKATQLHNSQMAVKIAMNSLYGACANPYFIYFINEMAEAITTSGQLSIRYAEKTVNGYMNKVMKTDGVDYIAYIDTDSIYVNMCPLIEKVFGTKNITREQGEKFLDEICKQKVEEVIKKGYEELAGMMGAYRNAMTMKREKITDKSLFTGKKHYIMNTLNSEGVHYEKPKVSVTGIESVRSSTPEVCREKLQESFKVIMSQGEKETQKFIQDFREKFFNLNPEDIAKNSGTDDIEKYTDSKGSYKKGCPAHVRGAILYNNFLKEKGLERKYESIRSGDKIKFVYLKLPNPLKENIISFPSVLPKEMGLHDYVDYETQFEKVFVKPLDKVLEAIGWTSKKIDTIEDFFS